MKKHFLIYNIFFLICQIYSCAHATNFRNISSLPSEKEISDDYGDFIYARDLFINAENDNNKDFGYIFCIDEECVDKAFTNYFEHMFNLFKMRKISVTELASKIELIHNNTKKHKNISKINYLSDKLFYFKKLIVDFEVCSSNTSIYLQTIDQCLLDMYKYGIFSNFDSFKNFAINLKNYVNMFDFSELKHVNLWRQIMQFGYLKNSLEYVLKYDDIDSFKQIALTSDFDCDKTVKIGSTESYVFSENISISDFCAFHGSINCFRYIILNYGGMITEKTCNYAMMGGNIETIQLCIHNIKNLIMPVKFL